MSLLEIESKSARKKNKTKQNKNISFIIQTAFLTNYNFTYNTTQTLFSILLHNFHVVWKFIETNGRLKGQPYRFSTLSLSIQIMNIIWNLTIFFKCSLWLWDAASISTAPLGTQWHRWFQEELQTVNPSPFPLHSRWASSMFVLRGFSGFGRSVTLVIESCATLNKRNIPMQWITTLETWQVLVYLWCNASSHMQALQEQLCEQDNSENSAFSVHRAETKKFIALIDYHHHQHWLDSHMKSGGVSL